MRDVYTAAVQCPDCGSRSFKNYRTCPPESDGSVTRYLQCRECGCKFKHISEPPEPESFPPYGNEPHP